LQENIILSYYIEGMNMISILFGLLYVTVALCQHLHPWTPIDWQTIPPALPTDKIDLFYLMAPLMEETYGDELADFDLFHGAIAFSNQRTGYEITINYDAFDLLASSLFPAVNTSGNGQLTFINSRGTFIYLGINESYWYANQYLLGTISGTLFNNYLSEYNSQINTTLPYYNLFGVKDQFADKAYLSSWDCFDFVWASLNYFYLNGATFNYSLQISRNYVNLYGSFPIDSTQQYENNPEIHAQIIAFYESIDAAFQNASILGFAAAMSEILVGDIYFYHSNQYYMTELHDPFVGVDYVVVPLPGQEEYYNNQKNNNNNNNNNKNGDSNSNVILIVEDE